MIRTAAGHVQLPYTAWERWTFVYEKVGLLNAAVYVIN